MSAVSPHHFATAAAYGPDVRSSDRDVLSLAMMDARNYTLALFDAFAPLAADGYTVPYAPSLEPPLWLLGHVGWFTERLALRAADASRAAAFDDALYDPARVPHRMRWEAKLPPLQQIKDLLEQTLEDALDRLSGLPNTDAALEAHRTCLFHEEAHAEQLHGMLQALALPELPVLRRAVAPVRSREALSIPAVRYRLGAPQAASDAAPGATGAGFCFDNERWQHDVQVPPFEIDAQPVTWSQYVEFIEDGGYDHPSWWSERGRDWLLATQRRAPLHVEQARKQVLVKRFGNTVRVALEEPVRHASFWEAQAFARWAGRRLPTEVEWEVAAVGGSRRGFAWGQVLEWTATPFRPYPGFAPGLWPDYSEPCFVSHQAVRGASFATSPRLRYPQRRSFMLPERDEAFIGFRTCAL
jgi:ergothioneine biosynthesis protein EgtB